MNEAFVPRMKMFRRRRKVEGTAFNNGLGDQLDALQPLKDAGLYCKADRRWMKWRELTADYGKTSTGNLTRRWICNRCGNTLKEELL